MSSVKIDQDYKSNVNFSIKYSRRISKMIGLWPTFDKISTIHKYLRRLYNTICYSLLMFIIVLGWIYIAFEVKNIYDRLKFVSLMSFCMLSITKYHLINIHKDDVRECVKRMEWDWKNISYSQDREIMLMNASFGKRLIIVTTTVTYSGFVFFYIAVPMKIGKIPAQDANISFIPTMFPFPKYIADVRYSPINEIVFAFQFMCGFLVHGVTSSVCSLAAIFTVHTCGQIQVMMIWLEHLIEGRLDMCYSIDQRIAKIVSQHVRILKFLSLIEKILQQVSYMEFLECTVNVCLLGYCAIIEWESNHLTEVVTYVIILITIIFNIFVFCYIGELLADQSRKIGEVTYMIEWYRLSGKKKLCCVLIIAMSNSSMKLTAGNLIELSMSTFSDVVKTSFAFLNVLRTLT
ncbi:odorant receptor 85c-like [Apis florea]|uniref:odorant receptor 85c-like n=1 Tax=Apis florea TaxID=7463 RepID=UPI000252AEFD|nr:odorant receptor 85c-like [Apis florea]